MAILITKTDVSDDAIVLGAVRQCSDGHRTSTPDSERVILEIPKNDGMTARVLSLEQPAGTGMIPAEENMPTQNKTIASALKRDDFDPLVDLLRLLADPTRIKTIMLLRQGERNVTTLCGELCLSQPLVSHHLGLLRRCNLVRTRRAGKEIFYSLNEHVEPEAERGLKINVEGFEVRLAACAG